MEVLQIPSSVTQKVTDGILLFWGLNDAPHRDLSFDVLFIPIGSLVPEGFAAALARCMFYFQIRGGRPAAVS